MEINSEVFCATVFLTIVANVSCSLYQIKTTKRLLAEQQIYRLRQCQNETISPNDSVAEDETSAASTDTTHPIVLSKPKWRGLAETCCFVAEENGLTSRECDVLVLLARGYNQERIAQKLYISQSTAKTHSYNIYRKLGIHSQQNIIDLIENDYENLPIAI
ncbi:MAG: helix-turn-helix transcriptional regulator [Gordonibacter sp.]|nr:helix-turn-helix transcriptional regulator [Gordonibacter sp.]